MGIDILAIGVHPDDVELSCSGTIALHVSNGYSCGILDLTQGELGTRGNAELRLWEAEKAASILKVSFRENLGFRDGFFTIDENHLLAVIKKIRKHKPQIVLANSVRDRHPDHGRAAELVRQACFLSGLIKINTTDETGLPQQAWRPKSLYHYVQDYHIKPDVVVDITGFFETKIKAIQAFSSQFFDPESKEPETPISTQSFLEFVRARAREFGRPINAEYGEAFVASRQVGVKDLLQLV